MTAAAVASPDASKLVANAISNVGDIATLPEVTVRIIQIVENPKSTARDMHDVIKNDPVLASRILKVVNSAFYGLPGQIGSFERAVVLLGLSAVKNIAIAASMTHMFNGSQSIEGFSGKAGWDHAVAVAVGCRLLSAAQGKPNVEESFLAGLLHDLGLLVERQLFAAKLTEVINRSKAPGASFCQLETEIIGADHQAFGMALATKWRFPAHLCTAIGYHHKPLELAPANRELPALVRIADVLACNAGIGFCGTACNQQIEPELLQITDLNESDLEETTAKLPEQVALTQSLFGE